MNYSTKQKNLIINFLKNNSDKSFSAKELFMNLQNDISKATLYRNLQFLEENNEIKKFYDSNTDSYEFQYANKEINCSNHLHLKCTCCGKLIHMHCNESTKLFEHMLNEHGFLADQGSSIIYGTCKNCLMIKKVKK